MRNCLRCGEQISLYRKASSEYCTDDCYYEAKKERSGQRYEQREAIFRKLLRNEELLAFYYTLGGCVPAQELDRSGFFWGVSDGEGHCPEGNFYLTVLDFGYRIDFTTKNVLICKFR
ncbi:MAG: hypothetical protein EOP48_07505 [Sphingobacteriales bacterium]|nr:MAG: hypothetical protein EOP48_07505 [Sphingobacteriales bacterium]